jgi:hypothetical protein
MVTVKVRGAMVVGVTGKMKQKRNWKTHDKATTKQQHRQINNNYK